MNCANIDTCPHLKSLRSYDWNGDQDLAYAMRKACENCREFVKPQGEEKNENKN